MNQRKLTFVEVLDRVGGEEWCIVIDVIHRDLQGTPAGSGGHPAVHSFDLQPVGGVNLTVQDEVGLDDPRVGWIDYEGILYVTPYDEVGNLSILARVVVRGRDLGDVGAVLVPLKDR